MGPPGTLKSKHINPLLTDEQIIETFTPLEHRFHKWDQSGGYDTKGDAVFDDLVGVLEEEFPGESQILEKWGDYCTKWFQRCQRREEYAMPREEFLEFVKSTPCKDAPTLAKRLWVYTMHDTPDLFIGQSNFGGTLIGYSVVTLPYTLYPDIPTSKMSNPSNPDLLNRIVLAIDAPYNPSCLALQYSLSPGKHRRENRSSSSSGSAILGVSSSSRSSMRSATSDDFAGDVPFCVFQIGFLAACTGQDWLLVRNNDDVLADVQWKDTGYGVVVRLDKAGYPAGEVFVIFNYWRTREEAESGPLAEEIQWKDRWNTELPHIRNLYDGCKSQFFMAKIADRLEDLKEGTQFDFDILFDHRIDLIMAKKVTVMVQGCPEVAIIPNDIREAASFGAHKRLATLTEINSSLYEGGPDSDDFEV